MGGGGDSGGGDACHFLFTGSVEMVGVGLGGLTGMPLRRSFLGRRFDTLDGKV